MTTRNSGIRLVHYALFAMVAGTMMGCPFGGGGDDATTTGAAETPPAPLPAPTPSPAPAPVPSPAAASAWTPGQQIDGDDVPVVAIDAAMDQEGRVTAVFVKGSSALNGGKLFAVRGIPGAAGQSPQWSSPVRLDTDAIPFNYANNSFNSSNFSVAVSLNGNAHAIWSSKGNCPVNFVPLTGGCARVYSSTYSAASGNWSTPVFISNTIEYQTGVLQDPTPRPYINNRGDVAVNIISPYQETAGSAFQTVRQSIAWRASGQQAFQITGFNEPFTSTASVANFVLALDNSGAMVVAGQQRNLGVGLANVVAFSGSVDSGFPNTQGIVMDTSLTDNASVRALDVGPTGDILLTWDQDEDGISPISRVFAASKESAAAPWSTPVKVSDRPSLAGGDVSLVTDTGDALYYRGCGEPAYMRSKSTGVWTQKFSALPINCALVESDSAAIARDGSFLVSSSLGLMNRYNQSSNTMSSPVGASLVGSDYVLGFVPTIATLAAQGNGTNKGWKVLYVKKPDGGHVGAYLEIGNFDVQPTTTSPSGSSRPGIDNLWGFFLK